MPFGESKDRILFENMQSVWYVLIKGRETDRKHANSCGHELYDQLPRPLFYFWHSMAILEWRYISVSRLIKYGVHSLRSFSRSTCRARHDKPMFWKELISIRGKYLQTISQPTFYLINEG